MHRLSDAMQFEAASTTTAKLGNCAFMLESNALCGLSDAAIPPREQRRCCSVIVFRVRHIAFGVSGSAVSRYWLQIIRDKRVSSFGRTF